MTDKTIKKILLANDQAELITDSDIVDFAKANRLRYDDVFCCLINHIEKYENCWGCEHIKNLASATGCPPWDSPCASCSRIMNTSDNFKPGKKRYRMHENEYRKEK